MNGKKKVWLYKKLLMYKKRKQEKKYRMCGTTVYKTFFFFCGKCVESEKRACEWTNKYVREREWEREWARVGERKWKCRGEMENEWHVARMDESCDRIEKRNTIERKHILYAHAKKDTDFVMYHWIYYNNLLLSNRSRNYC